MYFFLYNHKISSIQYFKKKICVDSQINALLILLKYKKKICFTLNITGIIVSGVKGKIQSKNLRMLS